MKKSLSLLLSLAMVISMFAGTVFAAEEKSPAEKLQELGVIKGTLTGLDEEAEWKRQDVAILLSRLYGEEEAAKETTPGTSFTDLGNNPLYQSVITWAVNKELFKGQSETTFAPSASMTNNEFATVILRVLGQEQTDFAKNIDKAIELKLLPAGTDGSANAVRGVTYAAISSALDVEVDGKKLGTILKLAGYQVIDLAVVSASASVAKTIKVNFNDNLQSLSTVDVSVNDVDGNIIPVEKVTFDGKVATVNTVSALAQKAHKVTIAKATSKDGSVLSNQSAEFTYAKGVPASVAIEQTVVAIDKKVAYVVKDANGVDITSDYPLTSFDVASSKEDVIEKNELKALKADMSIVSLTLKENNEVKTGNVTINVSKALSLAISEVKLSSAEDKPVYLKANNGVNNDNTITFTVKNQNGDAVTANTATVVDKNGYTATFASSNTGVAQVTNNVTDGVAGSNHGLVTALSAGSATITVTVEYGGQKAVAQFVVVVKGTEEAASYTLDKTSVTVVNNVYEIGQQVKVTVYNQYGDVFKNSSAQVKVTTNDKAKAELDGDSSITEQTQNVGADGTITFNVNTGGSNGTATLTFEVVGKSALGKKTVTVNSVAENARKTGYEVTLSELKLDADFAYKNSDVTDRDTSKAAAVTSALNVYVIDANGNRVYPISNVAADGTTTTDEKKTHVKVEFKNGLLQIDANKDNITVVDKSKRGKETVTVSFNGVVLKTFEVEVVATSQDVVVKAVQVKSSIEVTNGQTFSVIGNSGTVKAEAFIGYDVREKKVDAATIDSTTVSGATTYHAVSGNTKVVTFDASTGLFTAAGEGTTTISVKVNGEWKTITVVVKASSAV